MVFDLDSAPPVHNSSHMDKDHCLVGMIGSELPYLPRSLQTRQTMWEARPREMERERRSYQTEQVGEFNSNCDWNWRKAAYASVLVPMRARSRGGFFVTHARTRWVQPGLAWPGLVLQTEGEFPGTYLPT